MDPHAITIHMNRFVLKWNIWVILENVPHSPNFAYFEFSFRYEHNLGWEDENVLAWGKTNGAPECSLDSPCSHCGTWCSVECVRTAFPGFKCSRRRLVPMCIKCEWTLYILKLFVLCKKLVVQFWSYFLWQKCIKWNLLIFILFKKWSTIKRLNSFMCFSGCTIV